jgi:hypothetical protein
MTLAPTLFPPRAPAAFIAPGRTPVATFTPLATLAPVTAITPIAVAPVTVAPISITPIPITAADLDHIALLRGCRTVERDGRSRGYGGKQSTGRKGGC